MFTLGFAGSSAAQGAPSSTGAGSKGGMRPPGGEMALQGPPSPAMMRDSVGVTGEQLERYTRLYANHTAETRPLRDSLQTTMQSMRSAYRSGDRSEARTRHQSVEQEWKQLSARDQAFDKAVKDVLTKDQQKRYEKWKAEREKAARERQHRERPVRAAGLDAPGRAPGSNL